ncbi:MAG: glycosyltransferase [bacterium]
MKMCNAFAHQNMEICLIAKAYNKKILKNKLFERYGVKNNFNIQLIIIPKIKYGAFIFSLPQLFFKLSNIKKEEILIYGRDIYGISWAAFKGFRVIYESHGTPQNYLTYYLEKRLLRNKKLLKIVFISEALRNIYNGLFDISSINTQVCHDAADIPEQSYCKLINYCWPSSTQNTLQVGYIGSLYKGRGIEVIIKCAKLLPNIDFHIVGGNKKLVSYWRSQVEKINNIYFHGFVLPKFTSYFRSKCDILLMPYQTELAIAGRNVNTSSWMSPMKLFEYMSSCKAIISSDLPVLREILNDSNSILVECNNVYAWIEAINYLRYEEHRMKIAQKAYNDFISFYTWNERAKRILADIK